MWKLTGKIHSGDEAAGSDILVRPITLPHAGVRQAPGSEFFPVILLKLHGITCHDWRRCPADCGQTSGAARARSDQDVTGEMGKAKHADSLRRGCGGRRLTDPGHQAFITTRRIIDWRSGSVYISFAGRFAGMSVR